MQEQLKIALHEQQQGTLITGPRQTLQQFLPYWLEDVQKPAVHARTYLRYETQLRLHILPLLGSKELSKLSPQHVQNFYSQMLKKGLSPQSVRLLQAMLHKAFDYAVRIGLLSRNVCDAVTLPKVERPEIRSLTADQIIQLLQAARRHRVEALFVLASVTGMRRGELLGLKWSDINFC